MKVARHLLSGIMAIALGSVTANAHEQKLFNFSSSFVPGELIIKFKPQFRADEQISLQRFGAKVKHRFQSGALLITLDDQSHSLTTTAKLLADDDRLAYVEANTILSIASTLPNDPSFAETYGLHNSGAKGGKIDADIDAPEAWDITTGSKAVLVGIIDTGLDYNHPDLKENAWTNPGETGLDANGQDKANNGIDDDGNGYIDDWHGWDFANNDNDPFDDNDHGTHCAGTIGAVGNDNTGVAGVAWSVSLVGLKFLSSNGSGTLDSAVKAIEYATALGVDLTSNSWGGGGYSPTLAEAIAASNEAGILFVAAAGNNHGDNDSAPHYPSNYALENVVAVAATDNQDALASFSNFGEQSVHLAAPGHKIFSTAPNNSYISLSGTSMATPHVAGVAALIKAAYPELRGKEIKDRLLRTVDPLPGLRGKLVTGGRLNAYNALEDDLTPPGVVAHLQITTQAMTSLDLSFTAAGDDGNDGQATSYEVRRSPTPILSPDAWSLAMPVTAVPLQEENSLKVLDLPYNAKGWLAVRARDNVGNLGDLGPSLPFALKTVSLFAHFDGENFDGVIRDDPWGSEAIGPRNGDLAYSDSPKGAYGANRNSILMLPPVSVPNSNIVLAFSTFYDLERGYDFGYVELSHDEGQSWRQLAKLTGNSQGWEQINLDLSTLLENQPQKLQLRFRMTSDYSVAKDGWKIDDVQFLGVASSTGN